MSTVTDTEILSLRARKFSVARIVERTGVPTKKVRLVLMKHGQLGAQRNNPGKAELREMVDGMREELKLQRQIIAGQSLAIEKLTELVGCLALDLLGVDDDESPDDAPMIPVPPLPARRVTLSRTHRILAKGRDTAKLGAKG